MPQPVDRREVPADRPGGELVPSSIPTSDCAMHRRDQDIARDPLFCWVGHEADPPISCRQPFAHSHRRPQKSQLRKALAPIAVYVWRTMYANICLFVMGMVMGKTGANK